MRGVGAWVNCIHAKGTGSVKTALLFGIRSEESKEAGVNRRW